MSKNTITKFLIAFLSLGLSACVTDSAVQVSTISDSLRANISKASSEFKQYPNNPASAAKLGDVYFKAFRETQNKEYRKLALEAYKAFSKLAPDNKPVITTIYTLLMEDAIEGDEVAEEEVYRVFSTYPMLKEAGFAPPSYVRAYKMLRNSSPDRENALISALKTVISDSPGFYGGYLFLFRVHSQAKRYRLAKAILQQGIETTNDPYLHRELYFFIVNRGTTEYTSTCYIDNRESYKDALSSVKHWAKILNKDPQAYIELANTYSNLGRLRLMLEASKRANEIQPNQTSAVNIADAYLGLGKISNAKEILVPLLAAEDSTLPRESYSEWAFGSENWAEYLTHMEQLIAEGDTSAYNYFRLSMVYGHIGRPDKEKEMLEKSIKKGDKGKWPSKLHDYYSNIINDEALIGLAKNTCETTEAEFAIGISAYFDGNTEKAKQYFQKIKKDKVTQFREYTSAVNLLKRLHE